MNKNIRMACYSQKASKRAIKKSRHFKYNGETTKDYIDVAIDRLTYNVPIGSLAYGASNVLVGIEMDFVIKGKDEKTIR